MILQDQYVLLNNLKKCHEVLLTSTYFVFANFAETLFIYLFSEFFNPVKVKNEFPRYIITTLIKENIAFTKIVANIFHQMRRCISNKQFSQHVNGWILSGGTNVQPNNSPVRRIVWVLSQVIECTVNPLSDSWIIASLNISAWTTAGT